MPQSCKPAESAGTQVLVLGLDGAGKTSLLHCLATGSLEQDTQPTQGFNAVSISRGDLHVEFLESESPEPGRGDTNGFLCFEVSPDCVFFQSEVKRICGRTGRGTCPRLACWCLWWTPPSRRSSPSRRDIYTSCWPLTPTCL